MTRFIRSLVFAACVFAAGSSLAGPILEVSPLSLKYDPNIDTLPLAISNAGDGQLDWEIVSTESWLSVVPASGSGAASLTVSVDRTGLEDFQSFGGQLQISSTGGDDFVSVLLLVSSTGPILQRLPANVGFDPDRPTGEFRVWNQGIGTLNWDATADQPWVTFLSPSSGSGDATVSLGVDVFSLEAGRRHDATIDITSNGGSRTVNVTAVPPAPPNGGAVGVYADPTGVNCVLQDIAPGVLQFHIVHTNLATAGAIEFAAPLPACMTGATWVADTPVFAVTLGSSQSGVAIGYPSCQSSPVHVLTITAITQGTSQTCCAYPVVPSAFNANGRIEATDCLPGFPGHLLVVSAATAVVNPDGQCDCMLTVRTEETTWGKLKSLYATDPAARD
jgi:hypothetical protein